MLTVNLFFDHYFVNQHGRIILSKCCFGITSWNIFQVSCYSICVIDDLVDLVFFDEEI